MRHSVRPLRQGKINWALDLRHAFTTWRGDSLCFVRAFANEIRIKLRQALNAVPASRPVNFRIVTPPPDACLATSFSLETQGRARVANWRHFTGASLLGRLTSRCGWAPVFPVVARATSGTLLGSDIVHTRCLPFCRPLPDWSLHPNRATSSLLVWAVIDITRFVPGPDSGRRLHTTPFNRNLPIRTWALNRWPRVKSRCGGWSQGFQATDAACSSHRYLDCLRTEHDCAGPSAWAIPTSALPLRERSPTSRCPRQTGLLRS